VSFQWLSYQSDLHNRVTGLGRSFLYDPCMPQPPSDIIQTARGMLEFALQGEGAALHGRPFDSLSMQEYNQDQ
jgi:hypothetical protein